MPALSCPPSSARPPVRRRPRVAALALVAVFLTVAAGCGFPPPPPPAGVSTVVVPAGNGFGGGTIWYPSTGTARLGGIAVVPGFLSPQSSIAWYGPLLASEGFVVFTIDTITPGDFPTARADQLLAALDYLTTQSEVRGRVDPNRLAVMGWSMGGGGSLEAAVRRPSLKAAVPLAAWNLTTTYPTAVPTLLVACQNDGIAPNASHSTPFYNNLPSTTKKAYLEIAAGDHFCVTSSNDVIGDRVVAWMKRFVNGDTNQAVCPHPPAGGPISASRSNCPY